MDDITFRAVLIPSGNSTAVEVPGKVLATLGGTHRPPIVVTIGDHTWPTRIAAMRGQQLIGISRAVRKATGIAEGDEIEVRVRLDTEPREVTEPPELARALDADPQARRAFDALTHGRRRRLVRDITKARKLRTRERRIAQIITTLKEGDAR